MNAGTGFDNRLSRKQISPSSEEIITWLVGVRYTYPQIAFVAFKGANGRVIGSKKTKIQEKITSVALYWNGTVAIDTVAVSPTSISNL